MEALKLKAKILYENALDFSHDFKSNLGVVNWKHFKDEITSLVHNLSISKIFMGLVFVWAVAFWILRRKMASLYGIVKDFCRWLSSKVKGKLWRTRAAPLTNQVLEEPLNSSNAHEQKNLEDVEELHAESSPSPAEKGNEIKLIVKRKPLRRKVQETVTNLKDSAHDTSNICWMDAPPLNRQYGIYSSFVDFDGNSVMVSKPKLVFSNQNFHIKKNYINESNQEGHVVQDNEEKAAESEEVFQGSPRQSTTKFVQSDAKLKINDVRCMPKCAVGLEDGSDNSTVSKDEGKSPLEVLLSSPEVQSQVNLNVNLEIDQNRAEELNIPFGQLNFSNSLINQVSAEHLPSQSGVAIICLKEGLSLTLSSNSDKSSDSLHFIRTSSSKRGQSSSEMVTTETQTSTVLMQTKSVEDFITNSIENAFQKALDKFGSYRKEERVPKVDAFANTDDLQIPKEAQDYDESSSQTWYVSNRSSKIDAQNWNESSSLGKDDSDHIKVLYKGAEINQVESTQVFVDGQLSNKGYIEQCGSRPAIETNQTIENNCSSLVEFDSTSAKSQSESKVEKAKPSTTHITGRQIKAKLQSCHPDIHGSSNETNNTGAKDDSTNEQIKPKHKDNGNNCSNLVEFNSTSAKIQSELKVEKPKPSTTYLTGRQIKAKLQSCQLDILGSSHESRSTGAKEPKHEIVRESSTTKSPSDSAASSAFITAQQIKAKYQNGSIGFYGSFKNSVTNRDPLEPSASKASVSSSKIEKATSNQIPTAHISKVVKPTVNQNEAQQTARDLRAKMLNGSLNIFGTESGCGDARCGNIKPGSMTQNNSTKTEPKQELTAKQIKARNLLSSIQ